MLMRTLGYLLRRVCAFVGRLFYGITFGYTAICPTLLLGPLLLRLTSLADVYTRILGVMTSNSKAVPEGLSLSVRNEKSQHVRDEQCITDSMRRSLSGESREMERPERGKPRIVCVWQVDTITEWFTNIIPYVCNYL